MKKHPLHKVFEWLDRRWEITGYWVIPVPFRRWGVIVFHARKRPDAP